MVHHGDQTHGACELLAEPANAEHAHSTLVGELQEVGKENLFVFGVDAKDVPRLREERKNFKDYDPRWTAVMKDLASGKFGEKAFFQVRMHNCCQAHGMRLCSVRQLRRWCSCLHPPLDW